MKITIRSLLPILALVLGFIFIVFFGVIIGVFLAIIVTLMVRAMIVDHLKKRIFIKKKRKKRG